MTPCSDSLDSLDCCICLIAQSVVCLYLNVSDKLLARSEKIGLLVDKSEHLSQNAVQFRRQVNKPRLVKKSEAILWRILFS